MPSIMRMVNILSRCQAMYRADQLREEELQVWHFNYALPLHHNPGLTQEQLARHVCADKCNVTRHLSRLEELGYVERRPGETDKRVMQVYATDKLEALVPRVREINRAWNDYILDGISPEELEQFEATLLKIARRAKGYVNSKDEIEG